MTETEVIKGCVRNDKAAQEQLFERYYVSMYLVCLRYSKNEGDAENALLLGFVEVLKNIKHYKSVNFFKEWITQTLLKSVIDNLRSSKHNYMIASTVNAKINKNLNYENGGDSKTQPINKNILLTALQSLSPSFRTIYNLSVIEELSFSEIGVLLDMSESTAKLNTAKAKFSLNETISVFVKKRLNEEDIASLDEEMRQVFSTIEITYKPELWIKLKEKLNTVIKVKNTDSKNWVVAVVAASIIFIVVLIFFQIKKENAPPPEDIIEVKPDSVNTVGVEGKEDEPINSIKSENINFEKNNFSKTPAIPINPLDTLDTNDDGQENKLNTSRADTHSNKVKATIDSSNIKMQEKTKQGNDAVKGFDILPPNLHPDSIRKHRRDQNLKKDSL